MNIITSSEKETFDLAKNFAKKLKGGEIIGLIGDLGAGKTIFVKGLADCLGIKKTVNSPTFVIMKIYNTSPTPLAKGDLIENRKSPQWDTPRGVLKIANLIHIDAYRLNNEKELEAIGAAEYFHNKNCITIIEWADKIKKILPKKAKLITIKYLNKNQREFILE